MTSATEDPLVSTDWLAARTIKPRTREHYDRLLDRLILPAFG